MTDLNTNFSKALIRDYDILRPQIESQKNDGWKLPNNYWIKILTNIIHRGSNKDILEKRILMNEFQIAKDFQTCQEMSQGDLILLFRKFVPGSVILSKQRKINYLLKIIKTISATGGLNKIFSPEGQRNELLNTLTQFKGIGCKLARNIFMDLYHPEFRNESIPVDRNWEKVGEFLKEKWKNPCKDEIHILNWRKKYVSKKIIKEDWEFDRLVYIALNTNNSNINSLMRELSPDQ